MDFKEFGLVVGQKLFRSKYLHYGFWEEGEEASLGTLGQAQEQYARLLIEAIADALKQTGQSKGKARMLDVGCGTGSMLCELLGQGYRVDGLVPADFMYEEVNRKLEAFSGKKPASQVFKAKFEDLQTENKYDVIYFSESYQYIDMPTAFSQLEGLLRPNGRVVICDFFGLPNPHGIRLSGGHKLQEFYDMVKAQGWNVLLDKDITKNVSPTIRVVEDAIRERIIPTFQYIDQFFTKNYRRLFGLLKFLFRKKIAKRQTKEQHRTQENFEKVKSYRLLILSRD